MVPFELEIARKYLIPKKKQLSVSLIALMSVGVISLVVWLLLLFLSITEGIEKSWLSNLTSLNGPLRISPTPAYFHSYYYQIDSFASASQYTSKTIGEKLRSPVSDPYSPEEDWEIPTGIPSPDKDGSGTLKDPVKEAYAVLNRIKERHPDLSFQDYEISAAMMRLEILNSSSGKRPLPGAFQSSVLTQVSYLATVAGENPFLEKLVEPPTSADLAHLFYLAERSGYFPKGIAPLACHLKSCEMKPLFSKSAASVHLLPSALQTARALSDLKFTVAAEKELGWDELEISHVEVKRHFEEMPTTLPPWVFFIKQKGKDVLYLPGDAMGRQGILLPKSYQDSGVKVGDQGSFSFGARTASSVQEQRLPFFVAGFYDPGILAIGNRCALVSHDVLRTISSASHFAPLDRTSANGIQVWFPHLKEAPQIRDEIVSDFTRAGIAPYWKVTTFLEYDFAKDLLQQFQSDRYLFSLIGIMILAVGCSNIISLLVLLVTDKKKEIGISLAMGASPFSIATIFGLLGALMGLVSSLIGTGAALLTLHNIGKVVSFLSFLQGRDAFNPLFYGASLPHALSLGAAQFILIITPLLAFIAGLIPAIKACRMQPSAILREP